MRSAVIVSTARTPIGKAYRGAFNDTQAQALGGHAIKHAVERAGVDPAEVDDVIMGAALQQGSTGTNIARQSLLRAGLPTSVAGQSIDRQCSSGLMAIATAAKQIISDGMTVTVGGGLESISLVQNENMNLHRGVDPWLMENIPATYMSMLETAEVVSQRYDMASTMKVMDKETKAISDVNVMLEKDEGNRPSTALEGLQALKPVFKGGKQIKEGQFITAGNASQLSDGASASVLMEEKEAEKRGCFCSSKIA